MRKFFKYLYRFILYAFAIGGLFLTGGYFLMKFQWTKDSGDVDFNNRKFEDVNVINNFSYDSSYSEKCSIEDFTKAVIKLHLIEKHYPVNAEIIKNEFINTGDFQYFKNMLQSVSLRISDSINLNSELNNIVNTININSITNQNTKNVFEWAELYEWKALKEAIKKDKHLLDSVAKILGMEPRLIATVLIGEQIRLFKSDREVFKRVLGPLKILSVSNYISYGVTGIKEFTAIQVEKNLKNSSSLYYLGKKYENLIQYKTNDIESERKANIINFKNHFYSYLYAGLILRQIREQWKKAGYDISYRPEILATLFNVGFAYSKPKANPIVGGSHITIGQKIYTFGAIAYEFYFSGELTNEFPYEKEKWIEIEY